MAATAPPPPSADQRRVMSIAASAAAGLRRFRAATANWSDREAVSRQADQASHRAITGQISSQFPGDAVLSEEAEDSLERLTAERVWIIDPLDGSREFRDLDRTDWAVHVALVVEGVLVAGAVALPAEDRLLATGTGPSLPDRPPGRTLILVSRTRPPAVAEPVAEALDAELRPMGSAGAKTMAVVCGAADAYLHAGGQHEWDSAAPVAVARDAGLHCSRLDGSPLRYNQRTPWLPDLLICRPEMADDVLNAAAMLNAEGG